MDDRWPRGLGTAVLLAGPGLWLYLTGAREGGGGQLDAVGALTGPALLVGSLVAGAVGGLVSAIPGSHTKGVVAGLLAGVVAGLVGAVMALFGTVAILSSSGGSMFGPGD